MAESLVFLAIAIPVITVLAKLGGTDDFKNSFLNSLFAGIMLGIPVWYIVSVVMRLMRKW